MWNYKGKETKAIKKIQLPLECQKCTHMARSHVREIYSSTLPYCLECTEIYRLKSSFKGKATAKDSLQTFVACVSLTVFNHRICIFSFPIQPLSLTCFSFPFPPPKKDLRWIQTVRLLSNFTTCGQHIGIKNPCSSQFQKGS